MDNFKQGRLLGYMLRSILAVIVLGFLVPERLIIPVQGAKSTDWNHQTFWYYPWGKSGVHKGIDIFAKKGTALLSATDGLVLYQGQLKLGGNVLAVLGPKWRIHYYAHLHSSNVAEGALVSTGQIIGSIGDSGNAQGKPPHLHYSVMTLLPYFWRWDASRQGWKKIFYLDPSEMLLAL